MSQRYDKILKEMLKDVVDTLITKVIGLKIVRSTAIETKLQITNEREADFILRVELEDGSIILLHIEFQATNYAKMVYRELRYWVYLTEVHSIHPMQYVFYIGNEPLTMKDSLSTETTAYKYHLIDMRTVDCEKFLHSDKPEEVIISILCNYQQKGVKLFITEILTRLKELVPEETLRGKYIRQVEVLSQLRDLQEDVCKEAEAMALVYDLERDVRFRQGRERGVSEGKQEGFIEGERKGLLEGIELGLELKYGSEGLELMNMVRAISTVDKLEEFKNLIKKAGSGDDLKGFWEKNM
jgi:predicted transposase YdaD